LLAISLYVKSFSKSCLPKEKIGKVLAAANQKPSKNGGGEKYINYQFQQTWLLNFFTFPLPPVLRPDDFSDFSN
jgi:hypothetical protein